MDATIYRCPVCQTPGFTARELHAHRCKAKDNAPLTLVEIAAAKPAGDGKPGEPVTTKENGGKA